MHACTVPRGVPTHSHVHAVYPEYIHTLTRPWSGLQQWDVPQCATTTVFTHTNTLQGVTRVGCTAVCNNNGVYPHKHPAGCDKSGMYHGVWQQWGVSTQTPCRVWQEWDVPQCATTTGCTHTNTLQGVTSVLCTMGCENNGVHLHKHPAGCDKSWMYDGVWQQWGVPTQTPHPTRRDNSGRTDTLTHPCSGLQTAARRPSPSQCHSTHWKLVRSWRAPCVDRTACHTNATHANTNKYYTHIHQWPSG